MVVVRLTEFAWKLRSNIKKFQTKICCFFVAAGLVFSVFFFSVVSSVESSRNLLFSAALSVRNFVVFHIGSN